MDALSSDRTIEGDRNKMNDDRQFALAYMASHVSELIEAATVLRSALTEDGSDLDLLDRVDDLVERVSYLSEVATDATDSGYLNRGSRQLVGHEDDYPRLF
jgi:hypothetical protein